MRPVFLLLLTATATATACAGAPGPAPCPTTFFNPIAEGADPWVVRHNGWYYLIQSRDRGIYVYRSERLTDLKRNEVRVWTAPTEGWNRMHIWAPELHFIDGKWYIYYAGGAAGPPFLHQRSGVLESAGDDPQGQYVDRGMLYTGDDIGGRTDHKWAIDLTVGRIGGRLYAVWSGWESNDVTTDRTPQHTYIAAMSDPRTISSNRVKISSPAAPWEDGTELDLQEGQEFLQRNGQTFIVYSTRESWLQHYKLGQLRLASADADPLNPASWIKSGPVFSGSGTVYGVGHASFTTSPDGSEDWIVYHSKLSTTPGWDDRVIRTQKFTWNADGSPNFGTPVQPAQPVAVPSGECR